ncbi:MAG: hypothetical protein U0798_05240 [Gemmataceae bacterium]
MKRGILGLVAMVVAMGATPAFAQEDAKSVIEKAITAMGGKEKLNQFPVSKSKFKGELSTMGIELKFEGVSIQGPGQYKLEMEGDFSGQSLKVVQIVDGAKVKTKTQFGGMDVPNMASDAEIEELKFSVISQEINQLTPLLEKTKKFTLKLEAEDELDGKKVSVVNVKVKLDEKSDKTREVRLSFDKGTGYLVRISRKGIAPGDGEGREVDHVSVLSEFKKTEGIVTAMKTVNFIDGKKFMTLTTLEHKNLEKADPSEFTITD